MPSQPVLVAVLDSQDSRHAAQEALRLARATDNDLVALSVMPAYEGTMSLLHIKDAANTLAAPHRAVLEDVAAMGKASGVRVKTLLGQGRPHEVIVDTADAEDAGIIVMARSRRSALERSVVGVTAARVIGYTRRDVLVVPPDSELGLSRILVGVDGSLNSRAALERAVDMAREFGGSLTAVYAIDMMPEHHIWEQIETDLRARGDKALREARELAAAHEVPCQTLLVEGEPHAAILDAAAEGGIQCIVMGSHGRTGLRRLLMGNVAERVLGQSPCAVRIVH